MDGTALKGNILKEPALRTGPSVTAFDFTGAKTVLTLPATQSGKKCHTSGANTGPPKQPSDSKGPFWLGAGGGASRRGRMRVGTQDDGRLSRGGRGCEQQCGVRKMQVEFADSNAHP